MPRRPEPSDYYAPPLAPMSEARLRELVVKAAHARGWRVFSLPIARTRRPVKDAVGYPDLTLARSGTVLWVELKTDKGEVSEAQKAWQKDLPWTSYYVVRPSTLDHFIEGLDL